MFSGIYISLKKNKEEKKMTRRKTIPMARVSRPTRRNPAEAPGETPESIEQNVQTPAPKETPESTEQDVQTPVLGETPELKGEDVQDGTEEKRIPAAAGLIPPPVETPEATQAMQKLGRRISVEHLFSIDTQREVGTEGEDGAELRDDESTTSLGSAWDNLTKEHGATLSDELFLDTLLPKGGLNIEEIDQRAAVLRGVLEKIRAQTEGRGGAYERDFPDDYGTSPKSLSPGSLKGRDRVEIPLNRPRRSSMGKEEDGLHRDNRVNPFDGKTFKTVEELEAEMFSASETRRAPLEDPKANNSAVIEPQGPKTVKLGLPDPTIKMGVINDPPTILGNKNQGTRPKNNNTAINPIKEIYDPEATGGEPLRKGNTWANEHGFVRNPIASRPVIKLDSRQPMKERVVKAVNTKGVNANPEVLIPTYSHIPPVDVVVAPVAPATGRLTTSTPNSGTEETMTVQQLCKGIAESLVLANQQGEATKLAEERKTKEEILLEEVKQLKEALKKTVDEKASIKPRKARRVSVDSDWDSESVDSDYRSRREGRGYRNPRHSSSPFSDGSPQRQKAANQGWPGYNEKKYGPAENYSTPANRPWSRAYWDQKTVKPKEREVVSRRHQHAEARQSDGGIRGPPGARPREPWDNHGYESGPRRDGYESQDYRRRSRYSSLRGNRKPHFNPSNWKMRYDGKNFELEDYLTSFEIVGRKQQWDDEEMGAALVGSLEGRASKVMTQVGRGCSSYTIISTGLRKMFASEADLAAYRSQFMCRRRREGEDTKEFAMALQDLGAKSYPRMDYDSLQQVLIDRYIYGNTDQVTYALSTNKYETMEEAIAATIRFETYKKNVARVTSPQQVETKPYGRRRPRGRFDARTQAVTGAASSAEESSGWRSETDGQSSTETVETDSSNTNDTNMEVVVCALAQMLHGEEGAAEVHQTETDGPRPGRRCLYCRKENHLFWKCHAFLKKIQEMGFKGDALPAALRDFTSFSNKRTEYKKPLNK